MRNRDQVARLEARSPQDSPPCRTVIWDSRAETLDEAKSPGGLQDGRGA
jgi:hypothetical protein